MNTYELKRFLEDISGIVAHAVIKELNPAKDLISTRALFAEFKNERNSIRKYIEDGKLTKHRTGPAINSPIKYSRTEVVTLLKAEEMQRKNLSLLIKQQRHEKR